MKKMIFAFAIGAAVLATPVLAQDAGNRGGWGQRDQTRQQAQQRADMLFQLLDSNHDGTVTRAEAEQAAAQFQAARGAEGGRGGGRLQRIIGQVFATAPSISLQQFEALMLARFDAQDADHDGVLSAAEREQARAAKGAAQAPASVPGAVPPPRQ